MPSGVLVEIIGVRHVIKSIKSVQDYRNAIICLFYTVVPCLLHVKHTWGYFYLALLAVKTTSKTGNIVSNLDT